MIEISQTDSLCSECHNIVPAKIIDENNRIIIRKICEKHGEQETIISSNPEWYYRFMKFFNDYEEHLPKNVPHSEKCHFNCGFCEEHAQSIFLPVVPITSACNLNCPVCYTINKNGRTGSTYLCFITICTNVRQRRIENCITQSSHLYLPPYGMLLHL